jgi:hypothetical protein
MSTRIEITGALDAYSTLEGALFKAKSMGFQARDIQMAETSTGGSYPAILLQSPSTRTTVIIRNNGVNYLLETYKEHKTE